MREIKFRAWDKIVGRMWSPIINPNGLLMASNGFGSYVTFYEQEEQDPLMQFTGLKDKNGVEIYESDLIKVYHNGVAAIGLGTVVFSHGYVGGWVLTTDNNDSLTIGTRTGCVEVMGNIHENKDLLE